MQVGAADPQTGKVHALMYDVEPYYVQEREKWGFWGLVAKLTGRPTPGKKFKSEGFDTLEIGPKRFENSGRAAILEEAAQIRSMGRCPF